MRSRETHMDAGNAESPSGTGAVPYKRSHMQRLTGHSFDYNARLYRLATVCVVGFSFQCG